MSKEHIHKLIQLIADQDGTIDYQEGELEELQDIVQQHEANASAPWLIVSKVCWSSCYLMRRRFPERAVFAVLGMFFWFPEPRFFHEFEAFWSICQVRP